MREIKFRGKRKNGEEILIGDLNHINGNVFIFPREENSILNSPDWFEVLPETIGQLLKEKQANGGDIYEGDIVGWDYEGLYGQSIVKDIYDTYAIRRAIQEGNGVTVIGNILQNPESK